MRGLRAAKVDRQFGWKNFGKTCDYKNNSLLFASTVSARSPVVQSNLGRRKSNEKQTYGYLMCLTAGRPVRKMNVFQEL
jgi:hypothetical protein